jgi:hypothetical protein
LANGSADREREGGVRGVMQGEGAYKAETVVRNKHGFLHKVNEETAKMESKRSITSGIAK